MKLFNAFFALIIAIFISACQSTSTPQTITRLPDWVSVPPKDNSEHYYGIGTGYNLSIANASALNNLTAKLGVTVSSIYQQREQTSNSQYQKYVDDQIDLSTEKTLISDFKVLKNEVVNGQVYSLIQVKKSQLLDDSQQSLDKENSKATKQLKKHLSTSSLLWYLESNKLLKASYSEAYRYAAIVNLLKPERSINQSIQPWQDLSEQSSALEEKVCIDIVNQDAKSAAFVSILTTHLSAQKINVMQQCGEKLLVSSKEKKSILYGKHISSVELKVEYQPKPNSTRASKNIHLSGQSVTSEENARKASDYSLINKLNNQDIWQMLEVL